MTLPKARPSRVRRIMRCGFRWTRNVFALIGFGFVTFTLCFDASVIVSESLKPTLKGTGIDNGDWVLSEKMSYWFRRPHRWEVVVLHYDDGEQVMKRVVGLPQEQVSLLKHRVFINGREITPPSSVERIKYFAYGNLHRGKAASCAEGYYVLGDNSWDSQDSRFEGPVRRDRIEGRAWWVVWPLERFGRIN